MKEKLVQISLLGGFYLLISFLLGLFDNWLLAIVDVILIFALVAWVLILLFIKPRNFINNFRRLFPKTSLYLVCVGWVAYLSLPVYVWGVVEGYNAAMEEYNGVEYTSHTYDNFMMFFNYLYISTIAISLTVATFLVARKIMAGKKI